MLGLLPGPSSLTGVDPSAPARIPGNSLSTTLPTDTVGRVDGLCACGLAGVATTPNRPSKLAELGHDFVEPRGAYRGPGGMAADPCRGTYSHTSWKARIRTRRGNTDAPSVRTRSRRRRSQRTGADAGGGRDARTLPTDRQSYSHDERHERDQWPRVAQPRRLKAPESNRRHRSKVDVLAHAAKEANVLQAIGDSAGLCARSQHPPTTAIARHVPRHRF